MLKKERIAGACRVVNFDNCPAGRTVRSPPVVPLQREMYAFDGAVFFFDERPDSRLDLSLREDPVEPGTPGHPFDTLPELVGMNPGIRIGQDSGDSPDVVDCTIERIKVFVVPDDDRAHVTFFDSIFNQTDRETLRGGNQTGESPSVGFFAGNPVDDRISVGVLFRIPAPPGPRQFALKFYSRHWRLCKR